MTQQTDQDLELAIANLAQEVRVGFANIDTKFANIDIKFANIDTKFADLRGDIRELKGDIKALDNKFEERTQGFGQRLNKSELLTNAIINTIVGGLLLALAKFLFFGKF
jgi:peptidoglycan hydrolase CwlO-like protein